MRGRSPDVDRSGGADGAGAPGSQLVDYDRVASRYHEGRALPPDVLDRWARAVRPYVPPGPVRVVDVGAGTGIFAEVWPQWTTATVVAVEPSPAMVRAAGVTDPAVSYVQGVAEALPLHDICADVAWVSTALHHFADEDRAVAELARVVRSGGRALVRTYVPGRTEITWLQELPGRAEWEARYRTEDELTGLFTAHGFEPTAVQGVREFAETYAEQADWIERMRDADSVLTALSDEDVARGLEALRATPSKVGRSELTLLAFTRL